VKPISIKYELKDISKQDKSHFSFYNAHPKTTVVLKGMKYPGGVGYKVHVTVLKCSSADVSKELCPLIVRNLKSYVA
jgi:hypothetical protein